MTIYTGFVGTSTSRGGEGILRLTFDPASDTPLKAEPVLRFDDPTYIQIYGKELLTYNLAGKMGTVALYQLDDQADLTLIASNSEVQADLCHIAQSPDKQHMIACDYYEGHLFFYRREKNRIRLVNTVQKEGGGPMSPDQDRARLHFAVIDAANVATCVDLGSDRLYRYQLGDDLPVELPAIDLPKGKGPRHLVYGTDGNHLYVLTELTSEVLHLQRQGEAWTLMHTYPTVTPMFLESTAGAAIRLSADGQHLYTSSRGDDTLFHHRVLPDGSLAPIGRYSSLGSHPRDFSLTPDDAYLLICNRDSGNIAVYARNATDGSLRDTGHHLWVKAPMCLAWVE